MPSYRVGGGESTVGFFEAMGVPEEEADTNRFGNVSGFVVSRDEVLGWGHVQRAE